MSLNDVIERIMFVFTLFVYKFLSDLPPHRALQRTERGVFEREPGVRPVELWLAPCLLQEDQGRPAAPDVLRLRFLPHRARCLEEAPRAEERFRRPLRQGHRTGRHFRWAVDRAKGHRLFERGRIRWVLHLLRHGRLHLRIDVPELASAEPLAGRVGHDVRPERRSRVCGRQGQTLEPHKSQGQGRRSLLRNGFQESHRFRGSGDLDNLVQRMARRHANRRGPADVVRGLRVHGLPPVRALFLSENDEKMDRKIRGLSKLTLSVGLKRGRLLTSSFVKVSRTHLRLSIVRYNCPVVLRCSPGWHRVGCCFIGAVVLNEI